MGRISVAITFSTPVPARAAGAAGAGPGRHALPPRRPVTSMRSGSLLATRVAPWSPDRSTPSSNDGIIVVPGRSGSSRYSTVLVPDTTSPGRGSPSPWARSSSIRRAAAAPARVHVAQVALAADVDGQRHRFADGDVARSARASMVNLPTLLDSKPAGCPALGSGSASISTGSDFRRWRRTRKPKKSDLRDLRLHRRDRQLARPAAETARA